MKKAHLFLLFFVSFLIYSSTLANNFSAYDDYSFVVDNPYIKNLAYIPQYFLLEESLSLSRHWSYRPLRTLSFALDFLVWRLNPFGYHLTSICLHALNGILVYLILCSLLTSRGLAFIAALLFISHPVQSEAVAWISCRGDLLCGFFFLLGFFFFLRKRYLASILVYPLGLFSKETAVVFLPLLVAYEMCFRKKEERTGWRYYAFLLGITAVYFLVRHAVLGSFAHTEYWRESFYDILLTSSKILLVYVRLVLLPMHLRPIYTMPIAHSLSEPGVFISILFLAIMLLFMTFNFRRSKKVVFAAAWFFLPLIPVSSVVSIVGQLCEHFLYLSLLGACLLFVLLMELLERVARAAVFRRGVWIVSLSLVGLYSAATINRSLVWGDEIRLWSETVRYEPLNFRSRLGLGCAYLQARLYKEAVGELREAERVGGPLPEVYRCLMFAYQKLGRNEDLLEEFYGKALRFKIIPPAALYSGRGGLYLRRGLLEEAIEEFKRAISLDANCAEAHYGLGSAYDRLGRKEGAIEEYRTVIRLSPADGEAHYALGTLYAQQGRPEAIRELKEAVRLRPDFAPAHYNLAVAYAGCVPPQKDLALRHLRKAVKLGYTADQRFIDYLRSLNSR